MALVLNEDWTVYVVGQLHKYRIKNPELAERCGYHPTYLSTVLNGNKVFESEESAKKTREKILSALKTLTEEKQADVEEGSEAQDEH